MKKDPWGIKDLLEKVLDRIDELEARLNLKESLEKSFETASIDTSGKVVNTHIEEYSDSFLETAEKITDAINKEETKDEPTIYNNSRLIDFLRSKVGFTVRYSGAPNTIKLVEKDIFDGGDNVHVLLRNWEIDTTQDIKILDNKIVVTYRFGYEEIFTFTKAEEEK